MKNFKIEYSARAKKDLRDLAYYIALDNKERALSFRKEIEQEIANLSGFPYLGKETDKGKRSIVKKPYIIYYVVNEETKTVEILHIRHGARKSLQA